MKQQTIKMLKAISDETRLSVIILLNSVGERCVSDILTSIKVEPTLMSHHLSVLREMKIVKSKRVSKSIFYNINPDVISGNSIQIGEGITVTIPGVLPKKQRVR